MKKDSRPIVICKKIYNIVYTGDGEKCHESKTIQYFLPHINFKSVLKALNILLLILLLIAIFTDKIKEAAPIIAILEQLH